MDIGQVKTTRAFKYIILVISISVVASVAGTAPDTLTYTCDETGVNSITCKPDDCNHLAIIYGQAGDRKYCKYSSEQGTELLSCQDAKNQMSLLAIYEELTTAKLIGGKMPVHYKLNCIGDGNTVSHNATVFKAKPVQTIQHTENENIIYEFSLGLMKNGGKLTVGAEVNIGDTLTLLMTGSGVVIDPLSCSAYSKLNIHDKVILWEKDNKGLCQNREAAIFKGSKWSHYDANKSNIKIDFFAFRFTTDAEVLIGCTAMVCSANKPTQCKQICVDIPPTQATATVRRKRRDIAIVGKDDSRRIESSSVSFSVRDIDALDNGTTGVSVGNMKFLTVVLGLVLLL